MSDEPLVFFVIRYGARPAYEDGSCGDVLDEVFYGRPVCQLAKGHDGMCSCWFKPIRHGIGWERNYVHTLTVQWARGTLLGRPLLEIQPSSGSWWEPMSRVKPRGKRRFREQRAAA